MIQWTNRGKCLIDQSNSSMRCSRVNWIKRTDLSTLPWSTRVWAHMISHPNMINTPMDLHISWVRVRANIMGNLLRNRYPRNLHIKEPWPDLILLNSIRAHHRSISRLWNLISARSSPHLRPRENHPNLNPNMSPSTAVRNTYVSPHPPTSLPPVPNLRSIPVFLNMHPRVQWAREESRRSHQVTIIHLSLQWNIRRCGWIQIKTIRSFIIWIIS